MICIRPKYRHYYGPKFLIKKEFSDGFNYRYLRMGNHNIKHIFMTKEDIALDLFIEMYHKKNFLLMNKNISDSQSNIIFGC